MTMRRKTLAAVAFLAGLLALGIVSLTRTGGQAGLPPGGDFTLQSADGPLALGDLRGKVVLVFFGFLNCEDVCPAALGNQAGAFQQLSPDQQARVAGLMISVDPERDTPAALKDYAQSFHPRIHGVTGTHPDLRAVARRYGVVYSRRAADASGRYEVAHSADLLVVDPDGRLVARMASASPPAAIAAELRRWLR